MVERIQKGSNLVRTHRCWLLKHLTLRKHGTYTFQSSISWQHRKVSDLRTPLMVNSRSGLTSRVGPPKETCTILELDWCNRAPEQPWRQPPSTGCTKHSSPCKKPSLGSLACIDTHLEELGRVVVDA